VVDVTLQTLSTFAALQKVEESAFQSVVLGPIVSLWGLSDRAIRMSLLASLKTTASLVPSDVVNKKIFDPLVGGFSDSNAK
jgi:hypothetical protein